MSIDASTRDRGTSVAAGPASHPPERRQAIHAPTKIEGVPSASKARPSVRRCLAGQWPSRSAKVPIATVLSLTVPDSQ